jgi:hypothetical protein
LERKVDILAGLDLDHRQTSVVVYGQQIEDPTISCGELRSLRVERGCA